MLHQSIQYTMSCKTAVAHQGEAGYFKTYIYTARLHLLKIEVKP